MKIVKVFKTSIHLYTADEWVNNIRKRNTNSFLSKTSLGYYNPTFGEWDIHIPENQLEMDLASMYSCGKRSGVNWDDVLFHEYIHFLQHSKGCWGDLIPLGLGSIPMTRAFKEYYPQESWLIEAEAHWIMYKPHLLNWIPPTL
jgi:hypothetical protein